MFKKLILSSALITSFLFAGQNIKTEVKNAFASQIKQYKGVSLKILDVTKDNELGNNVYIGTNIIDFNGKKNVGMFLAFKTPKNDIVILPITNNTILFNKKGIYVDQALIKEAALSTKKRTEIIKKEQQQLTNRFLKYFNKNDKPIVLSKGHTKTLVIITDPNCPFCVQKLHRTKELKKLAQKYNIVIILAPIVEYDKNGHLIRNRSLHPNSPYYAATILTKMKNAKNIDEKLKILKKYFEIVPRNDKNVKKLKYDKKELKTVRNNTIKYYNKIGIKGTPTFIILDKNETKTFFNKLK